MMGESMTVTGTEVREEVAKVWPITARAVIGQRAMTGTRFFPKKSRRVARVAEKVERAGEEVERETARWQSTRLVRSRAQPSGGEAIVKVLGWNSLANYSYQQLTEQILRSEAAAAAKLRLSWVPAEGERRL